MTRDLKVPKVQGSKGKQTRRNGRKSIHMNLFVIRKQWFLVSDVFFFVQTIDGLIDCLIKNTFAGVIRNLELGEKQKRCLVKNQFWIKQRKGRQKRKTRKKSARREEKYEKTKKCSKIYNITSFCYSKVSARKAFEL